MCNNQADLPKRLLHFLKNYPIYSVNGIILCIYLNTTLQVPISVHFDSAREFTKKPFTLHIIAGIHRRLAPGAYAKVAAVSLHGDVRQEVSTEWADMRERRLLSYLSSRPGGGF